MVVTVHAPASLALQSCFLLPFTRVATLVNGRTLLATLVNGRTLIGLQPFTRVATQVNGNRCTCPVLALRENLLFVVIHQGRDPAECHDIHRFQTIDSVW